MKRVLLWIVLTIALLSMNGCGNKPKEETSRQPYGVFINSEPEDLNKMTGYDVVVIDAYYFGKQDIQKIRDNGCKKIYSYLNVGSLEEFRDYYKSCEKYTVGNYENWEEEKWIDITAKEWQEQVIANAGQISQKGVDGFFLDNFDVYYEYQTEDVYTSLISILQQLGRYEKEIVINGGDVFVTKYLSDGEKEGKLFDAVNQEDVYTEYDFDDERYTLQNESVRKYYEDYLRQVSSCGYEVFVIEYADNEKIREEALRYHEGKNRTVFISDNINFE